MLAVAGVMTLAIAAVLWTRCGLHGCPDVAHLGQQSLSGVTVIKDRSGNELARVPPLTQREISIDSLPDYVPVAFVAMEDKRFFQHHGIDWHRVAGAAYHNMRALAIEQGSSTITMQLARNVFPDRLPANRRTFSRKLEEARVAQMIEGAYSKRRILEMYLNEIYFGRGAYGIDAATREYFGKPASQLTLDEAALLAGLPRAPSFLNPRSNLDEARKGRAMVLERMAAQGRITRTAAKSADTAPVRLRRRVAAPDASAPYFIQAVRQLLEDSLSEAADRYAYTVETTLDSKLQRIAEEELDRQLVAVESGAFGSFVHPAYDGAARDSVVSENGTPYLQGALLFLDPRTGDVRALIGGRDYHDSQFNRAVNANRPMASTFKPFVFAAAIAAGYPVSLRLSDQPLQMKVDGAMWSPENDGSVYHDRVTMRQALAASSNVATVRLANMVGLDRVIEQAKRAGLSGPLPRVPSVALGAVDATPLELTTAYATLANLGKRPVTRLVTRVIDANGQVVWQQRPLLTAALAPSVASAVTEMLKDVIDSGTATPLRETGYRGVVAGKTGTSNASADFWFVGYTPRIVGTIWIGFDRPSTIVTDAESGAIIAPIWGRIMKRFGDPSPDWKVPVSGFVGRVSRAAQ